MRLSYDMGELPAMLVHVVGMYERKLACLISESSP